MLVSIKWLRNLIKIFLVNPQELETILRKNGIPTKKDDLDEESDSEVKIESEEIVAELEVEEEEEEYEEEEHNEIEEVRRVKRFNFLIILTKFLKFFFNFLKCLLVF